MMPRSQANRPFEAPQRRLDAAGEIDGEGRAVVLLHGLTATRRYVVQGRACSRAGLPADRLRRARPRRVRAGAGPAAYEYRDLVADLAPVLDELGARAPRPGRAAPWARPPRWRSRSATRSGCRALVQITPAYDGRPHATGRPATTGTRWPRRSSAGDVDGSWSASGANDVPERFREARAWPPASASSATATSDAVADALRVVPRRRPSTGSTAAREARVPGAGRGQPRRGRPRPPAGRGRGVRARASRARSWWWRSEGKPPLAWQGAQLSRAIAEFLGISVEHEPRRTIVAPSCAATS